MKQVKDIDQTMAAEDLKIAKRKAVKSSPKYTLLEMLEERGISKLKEMASAHRVGRYSAMKKEQLVDILRELLVEPDRVQAIMYLVAEEEMALLVQLSKTKQLVCDAYTCILLNRCACMGFLQVYYTENEFIAVMPPEIQKLVKRANTPNFRIKKARSSLIIKYVYVCVNLYGFISYEEFVALFNSQNEIPTDFEEVFAVLMLDRINSGSYCLSTDYIVSAFFELDDFESLEFMMEETQGKPRYIPPQEQLLKYSDDFYYPQTEQTRKMETYLQSICKTSVQAKNLLDEMCFQATAGMGAREVMEVVNEADVVFRAENDVQEFSDILMDLINHTRKWVNKGYTPLELRRLYEKKPVKSRKSNIIPFPNMARAADTAPQKIGRNQFCLCGSGKKYKNCCGKDED